MVWSWNHLEKLIIFFLIKISKFTKCNMQTQIHLKAAAIFGHSQTKSRNIHIWNWCQRLIYILVCGCPRIAAAFKFVWVWTMYFVNIEIKIRKNIIKFCTWLHDAFYEFQMKYFSDYESPESPPTENQSINSTPNSSPSNNENVWMIFILFKNQSNN